MELILELCSIDDTQSVAGKIHVAATANATRSRHVFTIAAARLQAPPRAKEGQCLLQSQVFASRWQR